ADAGCIGSASAGSIQPPGLCDPCCRCSGCGVARPYCRLCGRQCRSPQSLYHSAHVSLSARSLRSLCRHHRGHPVQPDMAEVAPTRDKFGGGRLMNLSWTLSRYLGRQFLSVVLITFTLFLSLIFIIELVELLRRGGDKPGVTFDLILSMALMEVPRVGSRTLPFAVLFGGMAAFLRLS